MATFNSVVLAYDDNSVEVLFDPYIYEQDGKTKIMCLDFADTMQGGNKDVLPVFTARFTVFDAVEGNLDSTGRCVRYVATNSMRVVVDGIKKRRWKNSEFSGDYGMWACVPDMNELHAFTPDAVMENGKCAVFEIDGKMLQWMLETLDMHMLQNGRSFETDEIRRNVDMEFVHSVRIKREFAEALSEGVVDAMFMKTDGTLREMRCTSFPPRKGNVSDEILASVEKYMSEKSTHGKSVRIPYVVPVTELRDDAEDGWQIRSIDVSRLVSF